LKHVGIKVLAALGLLFALSPAVPASADQVKVSYLYDLSDFMGIVPYDGANVFLDKDGRDIFTVSGGEQTVQIFNGSGMQVFSFGDDGSLGNINIYDGAVDDDGNIILLAYANAGGARKYMLLLCDYRGGLKAKVELAGVPAEFSGITPGRLVYKDGRLYLADMNSLKVLVVKEDGSYITGYDIQSVLKLSDKEVAGSGMAGFSVDKDGDLLFTIPVLFTAYRLTPELKVSSFGKPGGKQGKFGVIGGIASDGNGFYYVVDTLKCNVMVFDSNYEFQAEFGGFGYGTGDLIAPRGIAIDKSGRVYVSQGGNRGVSVYGVTYN